MVRYLEMRTIMVFDGVRVARRKMRLPAASGWQPRLYAIRGSHASARKLKPVHVFREVGDLAGGKVDCLVASWLPKLAKLIGWKKVTS